MNTSSETDRPDEIAVIGMACRFPGAKSVADFWRNLRDGVESISFFSDEELLDAGVNAGFLSAPNYVKARAILEDIEMFDASFFGFVPREAEVMDPQQRIFLETAWEALENAGYDSERYHGSIGVYAGTSLSRYMFRFFANPEVMRFVGDYRAIIANDKDHLATLTSYKLNLTGPSISVQTACSTSLVAVHLACQSLLRGECDVALAGGVSINAPQKTGYFYEEGGITSPDGHCRAFDARAQGTISGSGVGVVVLKRLADALEDGDCIEAVIKSSAVNNDGAVKVGYTAPSVDGQAQVIIEAIEMAGINADSITYVEGHGTATPLGDPIEVAALAKVFRSHTSKNGFCGLGSVKSNLGHLDAAAGVAGLIKTVLALKHRHIPPSLHFEKPNPQIDFVDSPFYVNTRYAEWAAAFPRRAGVSSFGIGGTNAHAILEESPPQQESGPARPVQLLLLSAKTATALETLTRNLAVHLREHYDANLADVAYTLQTGRRAFSNRRALVCRDRDDAVRLLETVDPVRVATAGHDDAFAPVVFMFPGQGSQYVNMGLDLYEHEITYREIVDSCCDFLRSATGLDLRKAIYPSDLQLEAARHEINQTHITQPALFVVEYALAKLWIEWGVQPEAMIGHSVGEYVAACLAGVLSVEDALTLVAARGAMIQQLSPGKMLAVGMNEQELDPWLGDEISLGAVNGPGLCVVSGRSQRIEEMESALKDKGVFCRLLHTSHAFHSMMMEPILTQFAREVKKAKLRAPKIRYISNVSGNWITPGEARSPDYWVNHLRQTVRFASGLNEIEKLGQPVLLEVGPGHALQMLAGNRSSRAFSTLKGDRPETSEMENLLGVLGKLWLAGAEVNWDGFHAREKRRRVMLPTYPFERSRYWLEPSRSTPAASAGASDRPISDNVHEMNTEELEPAFTADLESSLAVERIMEQQLDMIAMQLELLRSHDGVEPQ